MEILNSALASGVQSWRHGRRSRCLRGEKKATAASFRGASQGARGATEGSGAAPSPAGASPRPPPTFQHSQTAPRKPRPPILTHVLLERVGGEQRHLARAQDHRGGLLLLSSCAAQQQLLEWAEPEPRFRDRAAPRPDTSATTAARRPPVWPATRLRPARQLHPQVALQEKSGS